MESCYIDINKKWGLVVNYNYDQRDYRDMWAQMRSLGLNDKSAKRALDILSNYNTGMAVSNEDLRMSVIFISRATDSGEWWSTAIHEVKHVADAIIDYYGKEYDGEDAAYLTGFIVKRLVEEIGEPCIV